MHIDAILFIAMCVLDRNIMFLNSGSVCSSLSLNFAGCTVSAKVVLWRERKTTQEQIGNSESKTKLQIKGVLNFLHEY